MGAISASKSNPHHANSAATTALSLDIGFLPVNFEDYFD
jgi:hypothetical protein